MKTQSIRIVCVTISVAALLTLGLAEGTAAAPVAAAALYKTKCAACHGADGKGATTIGKADSIRDLSAADVQGQTDSQLNAIITNGKGKMPAYGKSLKPEQVTSLVAYIRSIASK